MTVLSTSIATLGLITNSTAVVIGAMLVAPLMSPILGLSLASVSGKEFIFQRAVIALVRGVFLAVGLSALIAWVAQALPFDILATIPAEVISRTHPTPFDLGIALAGGAAAAYALAQPHLSAALPGVAIATALVPPLATIGIGLSLQRLDIALGASLLFATNLVTISFAGIVIFAALGFRPVFRDNGRLEVHNGLAISASLVLLVTIPLVWLSLRFVAQAKQEQARQNLENEVRQAVAAEVTSLANAQLVDVIIESEEQNLRLVVTLRTARQLGYRESVALRDAVAARLQRPVALELIDVPMIRLDPQVPPTQTLTPTIGPSATPTPKPTATRTPVPPTPTATITPTPTASPSPNPTATPTPILAYVDSAVGAGVYLRDKAAGLAFATLPQGAPVQILYRRETVSGVDWLEVRDVLGRTGWVQARNLIIRP